MKKARILLVDQDNMFRLWVRHMLEQEEDMEIAGDYSSAEEAMSQIDVISPNIVLMDTRLPGMDGIEACRHLTGKEYTCDVIMLSTDQEQIHYALSAGTTYFFPKDLKQKELTTAIRLICKWQSLEAKNDDSVYSIHQIETMLMENLTKFATEEQTKEDVEFDQLSTEVNGSSIVQEVALVIPLPHDVSQLQRFVCRVEETLQPTTLKTVGSWNDTQITLKLRKPASQVEILDQLMMMPEVEKVEEKELIKTRRFKFFNKTEPLLQKKISLTLSAPVQLPTVTEQTLHYQELWKPQPQLVETMLN